MIAMMYLVLTALLALNVSKEILDAFLVVNESMVVTNEKFVQKIKDSYDEFAKQNSLSPTKVGPYWKKAQEVQRLTKTMVNYLDSIKYTAIAKSDNITMKEARETPLKLIKKKDNFDRPTNFFIGTEIKKGEAFTIKEKINEYKQNMMSIIEEKDRATFDLGLVTDGDYRNANGVKETWENHHFYHTILAADVTILNKLIAEVYNAEIDVVTYLYHSISAEDFKFNNVAAKVIPNSNYVFEGGEYEAEILVAASDTSQNPEVYYLEGWDSLPSTRIDIAKKIDGQKGIAKLRLPAGSEGTKKYAGFIRLITPWGGTKDYYFNHEYTVAKPTATISPTKMNVFYRGVDNPVSISASGKAAYQISAEATSGRISKTTDGWVVNQLPNDAIEPTIKVYADDAKGKKFMGEQKFRVKKLPDPIAKVPGAEENKISKQRILANPFLICQLPEWVDFQYDFKVTSFTMIIPKGGGYANTEKSENQSFTQKMTDLIKNLQKNDVILFLDIRAKGPEGTRKLESINITIQ